MIKQNVIIKNFNSLYEILEEIKENLPFNILKNENDELKDSLIVTNSDKKNLIKKNLLVLNEIPMPLNKLIELINISLIKAKFNYQSNISIKSYDLNLNSKFFSKDNFSLKLTEKEIEIILYLNKTKQNHAVVDLQKNIWGYSSDMETHTVETHIYRLRKKIFQNFEDKNFIVSKKNGYQI